MSANESQVMEGQLRLTFPPEDEIQFEVAARCISYAGRNTGKIWTEEDYLNAIRLCANQVGHTPSVKVYDAWRKNKTTMQLPSAPRIVQVFDRWSLAIDAAGLKRNTGTQPGHSQHFTYGDCIEAVMLCSTEIGRVPTYQDYERWQREQPGPHGRGQRANYPSGTTIRNRIRRKWLDVLKIVFD